MSQPIMKIIEVKLENSRVMVMPSIGWQSQGVEEKSNEELFHIQEDALKRGIQLFYYKDTNYDNYMSNVVKYAIRQEHLTRDQLIVIFKPTIPLKKSLEALIKDTGFSYVDLLVTCPTGVDTDQYPTPRKLIEKIISNPKILNYFIKEDVNYYKKHYVYDIRKLKEHPDEDYVTEVFSQRPVAYIEKLRTNLCVSPKDLSEYFKENHMMYVVKFDPFRKVIRENTSLWDYLVEISSDQVVFMNTTVPTALLREKLILSAYLYSYGIPQIICTDITAVLEAFIKINSNGELNLSQERLKRIDELFRYRQLEGKHKSGK